MSAKGVDFLELWIDRNVLPRSADRDQALRLAMKLESDAATENLTIEDLEIRPPKTSRNNLNGYT